MHIGVIFRRSSQFVLLVKNSKLPSCNIISVSEYFREEKVIIRSRVMVHQPSDWGKQDLCQSVRNVVSHCNGDNQRTLGNLATREPIFLQSELLRFALVCNRQRRRRMFWDTYDVSQNILLRRFGATLSSSEIFSSWVSSLAWLHHPRFVVACQHSLSLEKSPSRHSLRHDFRLLLSPCPSTAPR